MGARLCISLALCVEHARPHVELVLVVKMAVQRHSPVLHLLQTLQNAAHTHTHTHTHTQRKSEREGGGRTQSEGAHSGGRGTAFARVRRSKSSMRLTFHWSRKICHVPRQKVVTGMASNHSLPAPAFASLLPPLLLLLPARLTATREKGEQREVALCPLHGVDPPSELLVQTRSEPCRNKLCSSVAIVMHSNKRPLRILILAGPSSHHGSQVYAVAANEREDDERGDRKVQRSAERSV